MEEMEKDPLRDLFARLPEPDLPDGFTARAMERIYREAERAEIKRRRWERIGMAAMFVTLIVLSLVLKITLPWPNLRVAWPDIEACRFYFYIGALVFLLWTADSIIRRSVGRSRK